MNDYDVTRRNLCSAAVYDTRHEGSSRRSRTIDADDVVARDAPCTQTKISGWVAAVNRSAVKSATAAV